MKQTFLASDGAGIAELKAARKSVRALKGVKKAHNSAKKRLLTVSFDETMISSGEIERAIRDSGLSVTAREKKSLGSRSPRRILCWLITLFMLYLTLASRIILPIPAVFSYPLSAGITQLVLMLIVWMFSADVFAKGFARNGESYLFAFLASVCAALYSVPALIVAAWKISAGESVNIELFFDSAALLPTLATLGIATQDRTARRTEASFRELGLPIDSLRSLNAAQTKKAVFCAKISAAFAFVALIVSALSLTLWLTGGEALSFAVKCAVCVLVVACPNIPRRSATSIITQGVANCAKNSTPVNNALALEELKDVDTVIFESHDALTRSEAVLRGCVLTDGMSENMLLALAASALQTESDGVSIAILNEAKKRNLPLDPLIEKDVNEDSDVRALVGETRVLVGSYDFLLKNALDLSPWEQQVDELTGEGLICVMVASSGLVKGIITLESKLLPRVCETMEKLRSMKIETYVMATENTKAARVLALQVGADKSVYPADAEIAIRLLVADKRKTLYVYGGETPVFDVPGLKMNLSSNPLADAQVRGQLGDMPGVISISRRTFSSLKKRLRIWLLYEIICLPVAAGALYKALGFTLSPLLAAPLMLGMNLIMLYTRRLRKAQ